MMLNDEQTGSCTVKKGDIVFLEGRKARSLNILLQGKLDVFLSSSGVDDKKGGDVLNKSYRIYSIEKNIFIGANNIILSNEHSFSFLASEDCNIYVYPVQSMGQAWALINSQKDYGTYMVNSLSTMIDSSCSALGKLTKMADRLRILTENLVTFFWVVKEFSGFDHTPSGAFFREGLDRLRDLRENDVRLTPVFNRQFIETDQANPPKAEPDSEPSLNRLKIEYYEHLSNLPAELKKSFFGADMFITSYHCRDEAECLDNLVNNLKDAFSSVEHYFNQLYSENTESIYHTYIKAAGEAAMSGLDPAPLIQALDYTTAVIKDIVLLYRQEYLHKCETDLDYVEHSLNNIKAVAYPASSAGSAINPASVRVEADYQSLPEELKGSAVKILEYSAIPEKRADFFMMNLIAFRNMKDRLSTSEDARNIRDGVTSVFFEIYEAVFKKALEKNDNSRLINMFLEYSYMDEKLLTTEQTLSIYRLAGKENSSGHGSIHNIREWLTKIHSMEKDPSINEFGQDYFDIFRELKRRGQVSDKDKYAYDANREARLSYETGNMLKTNHKLCHGQISVYFPIQHRDMATRDFTKAQLTPEKIKESLDKILNVDFSAFYRELHYFDRQKGIEKELIMKPIEPEIILIPIYGSRAVMWQEITGRDRNTPGRFLLPAFTDEDPDAMLLRLVGNFRWELCRTMMGSAWNDVTQSSLTSEYTDYIQFFKKNRDLSEEAREKVKAQIVKYHNKMRDIFTADYETWINNESKGTLRLNKVARNILYRHCPFSRPIREQLEKQPIFADIAAQFRNQRLKTAKQLESRYVRYIRNSTLEPDLEHNLIFYRDL